MTRLLVLVLFLLTTPAWAAKQTCNFGQLTAAQAATGASDNFVVPTPSNSIVFQYVINSNTATVETQICCTDSCGSGGDWAQVSNSSQALNAAGTATVAIGIDNPACQYRTNITACASCNVDTFFRCGSEVR